MGIKELVLARLTGAWAVDHSVASGTGLLDLQRLDWDARGARRRGHRRGPAAAARADHRAARARRRRRPPSSACEPDLPVVVGAGDGPLANLGLGAVRPGVAACSIGTSGALRVMVERPAVDPRGGVFCYALTPGRWVVGGAINNGGVVLQWAGEALAPDLGEHPEAELLALAARGAGRQRAG